MADNIGSAILAGIQGVQQNARQRQAMLLQEQELDLARQRSAREDEQLKIQQQQLAINQDVNARAQQQQTELSRTNAKTRLTEDSDRVFGRAQSLGIIKRDGSIDREALAKGIKSGDRQYIGVVADILNVNKAEENLNRGKFDPTDFRFTGVDPEALKQGRLIATGQYSDGRQGVFTAQGGSEPNENVINTSVDEGVDLAIEALQMRVIPNSNMGATSAESRLNVGRNVGGTIADAFSNVSPVYARRSGARTVLNAIDASGLPVEASRTVIAQLAAIKDPKQKQEFLWNLSRELGVEAEVNTQGGLSSSRLGEDRERLLPGTGGTPITVPVTIKASDKVRGLDIQLSKKRAEADKLPVDSPARERLELEITDLNTQRGEFIRGENERVWTGFETESKRIKEASARPNATAETKSFWSKKQQDLDAKKQAFIKAGGYTPVMRTTDYAALEQNVLSKIKQLSPGEIATAVQNGQLKFSETDVRAMRARLSESGAGSVNAVAKAHPKEEIIGSFAIAYAQSTNPAQQQSLLTMIANTAETGSPFLSDAARREMDLQEQRMAVDLETARLRASTSANEVKLANIQALDRTLVESGNNLNRTEDGKPVKTTLDDARRWAIASQPRNQFVIGQMARLDPVAAQQAYKVHIGQASQAAATIFDEMPSGGFLGPAKDVLYSWFGDKPTVDTMAQRLENVRVVKEKGSDGVERVKSLYLVNRSTGRQQGKELTASQIQNMDGGPELFAILSTAGVINDNIASSRAAANAKQ
jgi:hypothetical protein